MRAQHRVRHTRKQEQPWGLGGALLGVRLPSARRVVLAPAAACVAVPVCLCRSSVSWPLDWPVPHAEPCALKRSLQVCIEGECVQERKPDGRLCWYSQAPGDCPHTCLQGRCTPCACDHAYAFWAGEQCGLGVVGCMESAGLAALCHFGTCVPGVGHCKPTCTPSGQLGEKAAGEGRRDNALKVQQLRRHISLQWPCGLCRQWVTLCNNWTRLPLPNGCVSSLPYPQAARTCLASNGRPSPPTSSTTGGIETTATAGARSGKPRRNYSVAWADIQPLTTFACVLTLP